MQSIRVTKYNPKYRNEKGHFLKDEWTSVGDIGEVFEEVTLTKSEYLRTEQIYCDAVKSLMHNLEVNSFQITKYEEKSKFYKGKVDTTSEEVFWENLYEGKKISEENLEVCIKLLLRNKFLGELYSEKLIIQFGYDFYMYALFEGDISNAEKEIKSNGLYIDRVKSPYLGND